MRTSRTRLRVNPAIGFSVHSNTVLVSLISWKSAVLKYKSFRRFSYYNETYSLYNENIPQAVALNSS